MKKLGLIVCLCWMVYLPVKANNPTLMRMDGKNVSLSEFLWYYHRTPAQKNVESYFQRFLEYQLKVADAKRIQLDTLPDFRRQCSLTQALVLKKHFMNNELADSYCQRLTEEQSSRHVEKEWVRMDVFTYRLSQHASSFEEGNAVRVMNELEGRLKKVKNITDEDLSWALKHGVSKQQDAANWTPVNRLLKELVRKQSPLEVGCWSEPFYSPLGIHLIRVAERRNDAGDEWMSQLRKYVDNLGTDSPAFNHKAFKKWENGSYELPAEVYQELAEAHDALLAVYWDRSHQHDQPAEKKVSPAELEKYFQNHKTDYRWEYPHYKGAVIHCLNKKAASKIRKRLKKLPMSLWEEALNRLQKEEPMFRSELECGLFRIGKNPYVDKLAFKCGSFQPKEDYPYTFLLGKKLKKGPEDYTDVLSLVMADYQRQHENDRFSGLFARFNVEIDKDVLKTVNSCGNK